MKRTTKRRKHSKSFSKKRQNRCKTRRNRRMRGG